jgi:hypothetical protein
MSRGELLSSLWQSFNSVIKDAISNEEIHIFFSAHTVLKTKTVDHHCTLSSLNKPFYR